MKTFLKAVVLLLLAAPACAWIYEHQQELLTYSAASYDWVKTRTSGLAVNEVPVTGTWSDAPLANFDAPPATSISRVSLGAPTLWQTPTPTTLFDEDELTSSSLSEAASTFSESGNSTSPGSKTTTPPPSESLFPLDPDVIVRAVDEAEGLLAQAGSSYAPPTTMLLSSTEPLILETAMQKQSDATVRWYRGPQTPDRQNFEYSLIGKGTFKVLIIGSLYGDETSSALFMDRLLYNLSRNIKPEQDLQLLLIRSGNPDGLKFARSANSAGVLLDENFQLVAQPAPGQQVAAKSSTHLETNILSRYIVEFKPNRVIHLRTTRNNRGMIEFGTHDESIAALVLQPSDYVIESLEGKVPANSLAEYVLSDKTRTYLNIYLPLGNFNVDDSWMQHREMVLTALKPLKLDGLSTLKQRLLQQQTPNQSPVNLMKPEGIPVSDEVESGKESSKIVPFGVSYGKEPTTSFGMEPEVELLPAPKEFKDAASQNTNTGYFELPPPPEGK